MLVRLDRALGGNRYRATVARAGVLHYDEHAEYVPASTLARSAASLVGLPLTVGHTPTLAPSRDRIVGRVVSATMDGDELVVELEVSDPATRGAIERGDLLELSPAYVANVTNESGVDAEAVAYDATQTGRDYRGGHVALLPPGNGRCGRECSITMDGAEGAWRQMMTTPNDCDCDRPTDEARQDAAKPYRMPSLADKWRLGPQNHDDDDAGLARTDGSTSSYRMPSLAEKWRRR